MLRALIRGYLAWRALRLLRPLLGVAVLAGVVLLLHAGPVAHSR